MALKNIFAVAERFLTRLEIRHLESQVQAAQAGYLVLPTAGARMNVVGPSVIKIDPDTARATIERNQARIARLQNKLA